MRLQVCNATHVQCPELTDHRSGQCPIHLAEARKRSDAKRPSARERGYTVEWERERGAYIERYGPDCECGCGREGSDVHHIDGLGPTGPLGFDWSNLILLAHECHSRVTASGGDLSVLRRT
ncbi:MAG TPA: HNH endonuclease signature motif containing protein [Thermoleophilaceae bacterium]|nr:HNH endonuclease signature motif containing protein [Thermoleophilaceae bacterium]